jgi:hypothetical protein
LLRFLLLILYFNLLMPFPILHLPMLFLLLVLLHLVLLMAISITTAATSCNGSYDIGVVARHNLSAFIRITDVLIRKRVLVRKGKGDASHHVYRGSALPATEVRQAPAHMRRVVVEEDPKSTMPQSPAALSTFLGKHVLGKLASLHVRNHVIEVDIAGNDVILVVISGKRQQRHNRSAAYSRISLQIVPKTAYFTVIDELLGLVNHPLSAGEDNVADRFGLKGLQYGGETNSSREHEIVLRNQKVRCIAVTSLRSLRDGVSETHVLRENQSLEGLVALEESLVLLIVSSLLRTQVP